MVYFYTIFDLKARKQFHDIKYTQNISKYNVLVKNYFTTYYQFFISEHEK